MPDTGSQAQSDSGEQRASERLDSWKEIAAYLRRDVRTVQRWERSEGLPVHRHLHDKQGTVYAYQSELETWWRGRQARIDSGASERSAAAPGATVGNESPGAAQRSSRPRRRW